MTRLPFFKYFRVNKYDTAVSEVSVIRLKPLKWHNGAGTSLSWGLPPDTEMFYGYTGLITALEKAKAGALQYINSLIQKGESGLPDLLKYRIDHYEDLWINLIDTNIKNVEENLKTDSNYQWKPYRIHI
jgi:hypothetical protein